MAPWSTTIIHGTLEHHHNHSLLRVPTLPHLYCAPESQLLRPTVIVQPPAEWYRAIAVLPYGNKHGMCDEKGSSGGCRGKGRGRGRERWILMMALERVRSGMRFQRRERRMKEEEETEGEERRCGSDK
ncbi:hypothetical protein PIB30_076029 [Stylosanthes scabra]|uniref:Uncharacterized protein n=1 Tax=Stylosanthes scabra TaxID=79078 RepID=A0ABU6YP22_9FABA|nr:hypothetical protein [Stylosanthes scabra]